MSYFELVLTVDHRLAQDNLECVVLCKRSNYTAMRGYEYNINDPHGNISHQSFVQPDDPTATPSNVTVLSQATTPTGVPQTTTPTGVPQTTTPTGVSDTPKRSDKPSQIPSKPTKNMISVPTKYQMTRKVTKKTYTGPGSLHCVTNKRDMSLIVQPRHKPKRTIRLVMNRKKLTRTREGVEPHLYK